METIRAAQIRKDNDLKPIPGRRVFLCIGDNIKVEMGYRPATGAGRGYVWFFINPVTGRSARSIKIEYGDITSRRERFQTPVDKFLAVQQKARDARRELGKPYLKKVYAGKPTRRYLRLIRESSRYVELTDYDLLYNLEGIAARYS